MPCDAFLLALYRLLDDRPVDVYYTWECLPPDPTSKRKTLPPKKLTKHHPPYTTYKTVAIPLPTNARPGERWRIGLSVPSVRGGAAGNIEDMEQCLPLRRGRVISAWSEGIQILPPPHAQAGSTEKPIRKKAKDASANGKGKSSALMKEGKKTVVVKQTRITRSWRLPPLPRAEQVGDEGVIITAGAASSEGEGKLRKRKYEESTSAEVHVDESARRGNKEKERVLKIVEETSYDLDKVSIWTSTTYAVTSLYWNWVQKIWDSGLALSSYLTALLLDPESQEVNASTLRKEMISRFLKPDANVIEIGAGTGLVTIALAAALGRVDVGNTGDGMDDDGETSDNARRWATRRLMITDLGESYDGHSLSCAHLLLDNIASALPLIEENVALNTLLWTASDLSVSKLDQQADDAFCAMNIIGRELDWAHEVPAWVWGASEDDSRESSVARPLDLIM